MNAATLLSISLVSCPILAIGAALSSAGTPEEESFSNAPTAANWSTISLSGGTLKDDFSTDNIAIKDPGGLDSAVNIGSHITAFSKQLLLEPLSSTTRYKKSMVALHNSKTGTIFTRPTLNDYTALMATVTNRTGRQLSSLTVSYDLTVIKNDNATAREEVPGHRVYYSTTGEEGSWIRLDKLSDKDVSTKGLTETIEGLKWTPGSQIYLLWADDNAGKISDDTLAISNVRWIGTL